MKGVSFAVALFWYLDISIYQYVQGFDGFPPCLKIASFVVKEKPLIRKDLSCYSNNLVFSFKNVHLGSINVYIKNKCYCHCCVLCKRYLHESLFFQILWKCSNGHVISEKVEFHSRAVFTSDTYSIYLIDREYKLKFKFITFKILLYLLCLNNIANKYFQPVDEVVVINI